jgi:hypothetical protein
MFEITEPKEAAGNKQNLVLIADYHDPEESDTRQQPHTPHGYSSQVQA